MITLHGYVLGFAVIAAWAVILLWALVLWVRKPEESPVFWRAVSVAQILLGLQLLAGLVLTVLWLVGNGNAPGVRSGGGWFNGVFHVLYGVVFPIIVLLVGHRTAREGRFNPHLVFAVVGLVIFGLTARAWMVGAGIGASNAA